ncbi:MAG: peroxiredoxin [Bacteroidales bacterium]
MRKSFVLFLLLAISGHTLIAQLESRQRIPLIGSKAPSFTAPSTKGIVHFPKDYENMWKILFSHPRDFTPVCSSEILELAYLQDEFKKLNAQILIISVDRMVSHLSWKSDLENIDYKGRGKVDIDFPFVVDSSASISYRYGMVDPTINKDQTVRGVFFIDPEDKVRAFQFYPNQVGRNIDEILRTLKALQTQQSLDHGVLPANWEPGDDYMLPFLTPEDKENLEKPDSEIFFINWYMIFRRMR